MAPQNVPPAVVLPGSSAVPRYDALKSYYSVPNFHIGGTYRLDDEKSCELGGEGGTTLESLGLDPVQIGYVTVGTPHRDAQGRIDNAILMCPYYSGDSTNMLDFWGEEPSRIELTEGIYIGPGRVFDTDRYYLIMADALGLWGASRPASSHPGRADSQARGRRFPQYSLEDCVQLMHRLLVDHLDVKHVKMVTGVSLGASLTYLWGVMHPDFMDALLPIGGTPFQNRGMARWLFDLATAAIMSDPVYREHDGDYYHLPAAERPLLGNLFSWSILRQSAYVDEMRCAQAPEQYALEAFDWEKSSAVIGSMGTEGFGRALYPVALIDSNDLIWRNRAQGQFDVEPELHRVKARTLIIHIETDQWLRPHIARRAQERIKGARLLTFSHDMGHYAVFSAPGRYGEDIRALLETSPVEA